MLFGAPDLSFTQFMVETLSVVILALVMTRLRLVAADHRPRARDCSDGAVALPAALGFGLLLLKVTQAAVRRRAQRLLQRAFARRSRTARNIVNVIIVDFRGLDTLGEIAVVMIAGLAILALIRMRAAATPAPSRRRRR